MASLFEPLTIGGVTLPNRIQVSPMCQYSAVEGVAQDWHLIHLGGLMMSGAGLLIAEATAIEPAGRITHDCLGLWNDAQEAALTDLVARIRPLSSARLGIQLGHAGRRGSARSIADRGRGESLPPEEGAWTTKAPSALAYNDQWATPVAMSVGEIAELTQAFVDATLRAVRAGFEVIEIHGAHGYLLHQFLSPRTNRRDDGYGGSPEGRMRFPLEVVEAVRAVLPASCALGFRVNSTDWHPEGLQIEDALTLCHALKARGVDYVTMSAGNLVPDAQIPPATPGHQVPFAARVKAETGLTTAAVGLITDAHQAEAILAEGQADMIALARGVLDDPRWGWHAAALLGVDAEYPPQYLRARPNNWRGYAHAHPAAQPINSDTQADRPSNSGWDRPQAAKG